MTTIHNHNPRIELQFRLRDGISFTVRTLFAYQSQRSLVNPAATANITIRGTHFAPSTDEAINVLFRDVPIERLLQSNDLCTVTMLDAAGRRHPDIIGQAKVVRPTVVERQGRPEDATLIQLQGLGSELLNYQIFWHPHIAGQNNLGGIGWLARAKGKLPSGRPDEVLRSIYETFLNDKYIYTLADGRKINQALRPHLAGFADSLAKTALKAMGMESALWATLQRYQDAPWGELFVDLEHELGVTRHIRAEGGASTGNVIAAEDASRLDRVGLYFRPTPFDFDAWDRLASQDAWGFSYEDADRMGEGEQLDRNEGRLYNFFWAPMKSVYSAFDQLSMAFNQSGGLLPIYDEESIKRHGLRRLEQGTEYVEMVSDADQKTGNLTPQQMFQAATKASKLNEHLVKRTLQLQQWFGYGDQFLEGALQTRGRIGPDSQHGARIGSVLTRKRDGYQFYVTGISQQWQFPGPHMTTWQVQRGHDPRAYRKWWQGKLAEHKKKLSGRFINLLYQPKDGIGIT